ncbi:MAG: tripartite tricarboxylate transporter TctB family protein [Bullifex sp.]
MKKYPIIEPILIVIFGIAVIIMSSQIQTVVTSIAIGPDFMPRLIGIIFVILGLALVPEALKKQRAVAASAAPADEVTKLTGKQLMQKYMHFIIWALALVYALLMKPLGFLADSILFMSVSMYLLTMREEKRNWPVIILVSIIVPTAVYIIFRQKFYLMLPIGLCKYIPLKILR